MEHNYKIKVFDSGNPEHMAEYMVLKTRFLNEESVEQVKEETTFTKSGDYVIALHWVEEGSASEEDRKKVKEILDEQL